MDVDVLLGGLLCGTHEDLLAADLAAQVAGQGHPVVERVLFRGDDRDRRVGIRLPQVFRARLTGDPIAEHDIPARHGEAGRVIATPSTRDRGRRYMR